MQIDTNSGTYLAEYIADRWYPCLPQISYPCITDIRIDALILPSVINIYVYDWQTHAQAIFYVRLSW